MIFAAGPEGNPGEPVIAYVPYTPGHGQQMGGPQGAYWSGGVQQDGSTGPVYVTGPGGQVISAIHHLLFYLVISATSKKCLNVS